mgnify:CR=1 FL=1
MNIIDMDGSQNQIDNDKRRGEYITRFRET